MKFILIACSISLAACGLHDPDACADNADCPPGYYCLVGCQPIEEPSSDSGSEIYITGRPICPDPLPCDLACGIRGSTDCSGNCVLPGGLGLVETGPGHCYLAVNTVPLSWALAATYCEMIGANWCLASLADMSESNSAYDAVLDSGASSAWIGLRSSSTCTFNWIDGSATTYTPWGMAQPDECGTVEACGMFWEGADNWGDSSCYDVSLPFVCEYRG